MVLNLLHSLIEHESTFNDATIPSRYLKGDDATVKQVIRVNRAVELTTGRKAADKPKRLHALSVMFMRDITSAYDLTAGEIKAFLRLYALRREDVAEMIERICADGEIA